MPPDSDSTTGLTAAEGAEVARFRSGAVARMARIPVATLRIWERRYQVVGPPQSAGGHRLYSAADVERLSLIRQLVERGHAISALAGLDLPALQSVAGTHASALAAPSGWLGAEPEGRPLTLAVVGAGLVTRLQRPGFARRVGRPLRLQATEATLAQALVNWVGERADTLIAALPSLLPDSQAQLALLARRLQARRVLVVYGFGRAELVQALASAGWSVQRDPVSDRALAALLADGDLRIWLAPDATVGPAGATASSSLSPWPADVPPRRYDDATLADMAGLSSSIACECPQHVAELLMQLTHFEAYSADCQSLSPADAALHAYLQRAAGAARAIFENALEAVARHEGLTLAGSLAPILPPASPKP